jgi:hypothetical protein
MVQRRGASTFVWIEGSPWGLGHCRREFIGARDTKAQLYAEELRGRLRTIAERDRRHREREMLGRQQEREASVLRLLGHAREAF